MRAIISGWFSDIVFKLGVPFFFCHLVGNTSSATKGVGFDVAILRSNLIIVLVSASFHLMKINL